MAGKSIEQRINDAEMRTRQLEAQKRLLAQHVKEQERKERTRRLVQIGAVMAKIGVDTVEKAQAVRREVEQRRNVGEWFRKVISKAKGANGAAQVHHAKESEPTTTSDATQPLGQRASRSTSRCGTGLSKLP